MNDSVDWHLKGIHSRNIFLLTLNKILCWLSCDPQSADFIAFSLHPAAIQVVCTRAISRAWRHCTCITERVSVSFLLLLPHTKLGVRPHCPSAGYLWTRAMMSALCWWTSSFPLRNAYAHLAMIRYGKVSLPQASISAVWHCRAFFPLSIWILMKHLCWYLLNFLEH